MIRISGWKTVIVFVVNTLREAFPDIPTPSESMWVTKDKVEK